MTTRVAIWEDDRWVELTDVHVDAMRHSGGKALAILATLEDWPRGQSAVLRCGPGVEVSPVSEYPQRVAIDAHTSPQDQYRDGLPDPPIEPTNPDPPEHAPQPSVTTPANWGGLNPKDVDESPLDDTEPETPIDDTPEVRFFTLTFEDGSVAVDQPTSKGVDQTSAEAAIRATWSAMGKTVANAKYQPNGRVGEDRPRAGKAKPTAPDPEIKPYEVDAGEEDDGKGALFRWHKGSLDDSMTTVVPCTSMAQLVEILCTLMPGTTAERVEVKHYAFDDRIDWDTYLVTVDGAAVGMTNGEL
tara:strand:+ start:7487 stop:8386 length:900 start_codon:yes stop_codon:yes gene_type:complete